MRRYEDIYAQVAADRDHHARQCAQLVHDRQWDAAGVAARKYAEFEARCLMMIRGNAWGAPAPEATQADAGGPAP